MKTYWQMIVDEIKHQRDPNYPIRFTNVRYYQKNQDLQMPFKSNKRKTNYTHYYVDPLKKEVYLTHREAMTVLHRIQNKTYPQIAEIMGIKTRTVEFYLKSIRDKLPCEKTSHVLNYLVSQNFFKRYQLIQGKIHEKEIND